MADNLGPMAWLFLPENVQVQYLQKIAQMRKKYIRPHAVSIWTCFIFRTKCDFLLPLRQLIFRTRRLMLCSNQGKGPHSWGRP